MIYRSHIRTISSRDWYNGWITGGTLLSSTSFLHSWNGWTLHLLCIYRFGEVGWSRQLTVPTETALSLIIWIILHHSSLGITLSLAIRFLGWSRSSWGCLASLQTILLVFTDNLIWLWSPNWRSWLNYADWQTRLWQPRLIGDSRYLLYFFHLSLLSFLSLFLFHGGAPALVTAEAATAWALWGHSRVLAHSWLFFFFFNLRQSRNFLLLRGIFLWNSLLTVFISLNLPDNLT